MNTYISYNNVDRSLVNYLSQILKNKKIEIWLDVEKLIAGEAIFDKIESAIRDSRNFIICLGKNGISNKQNLEFKIAYEIFLKTKSITFIPVLLPGAKDYELPFFIENIRCVDFRESFENRDELYKLLQKIQGSELNILDDKTVVISSLELSEPKNKKAVSVAIMFQDELLLVQRHEKQKSGRGLWQLPGGKVAKDETQINAAIREVEEEVGIILNTENLIFITDIIDKWIVHNSDDFITMSIFFTKVNNKQTIIAPEFQSSKWIKISTLFYDKSIVFFGSTERYLRITRRFVFLHQPLKQISKILLDNNEQIRDLPNDIINLSTESVQVFYALLSLMGFLNDKSIYCASSTLSGNILKLLSEWALTEGSIFEAEGDGRWQEEIEKRGDSVEVEKFRVNLFDQHKSFLGILSHRLPKVLSSRNVCDIIITGYNPTNSKKYLLIRWDFLANKFQIPAKGMEGLDIDLTSQEAAKFVVKERLDESLVDKFIYQYICKIKPSHVGANSLEKGNIPTNYQVSIFSLNVIEDFYNDFNLVLNKINKITFDKIMKEQKLGDKVKRALNLYLWVDLMTLEEKMITILGKKFQGFKEICDAKGIDLIKNIKPSVIISSSNDLPLLSGHTIENPTYLDLIKEYS